MRYLQNGFASHGRYDIILGERSFPPRASPWFSGIALAPAFFLNSSSNELGLGMYPIMLFAISGVASAFFIGSFISGPVGGVMGALFLLGAGNYVLLAGEIIEIVPVTSTALVLLSLYMLMSSKSDVTGGYLPAGILSAFAGAIYPLGVIFLIPFVIMAAKSDKQLKRRYFLLSLPTILAVYLTLTYNSKVFGSYFRTGHNYWSSIPYDFLNFFFHYRMYLQM